MFQSWFHNIKGSPLILQKDMGDNVMFSDDFIPAMFIQGIFTWYGPALRTHSLKTPLYAELSLLLMHVDFTTETLLVKSSFAAVRQEWESHASQIGTSGGKLKAWTHIHFTLTCMQKIHRWIYTLHKMKIVDSQLSLFYLHWLGYCLKTSCCWQLKNSEKEKSATEQKKKITPEQETKTNTTPQEEILAVFVAQNWHFCCVTVLHGTGTCCLNACTKCKIQVLGAFSCQTRDSPIFRWK